MNTDIALKKDQIIELDITDLNNLGCGVGRYGGLVIFVRGAVDGDRVRASIIKVNKSFAVARLLEILLPSPHRIDDDPCRAPLACGGCVYRHITYDKELELKREHVETAFRKAGLSDVCVLPTLSTRRMTGYRNKAQYPVTEVKDRLRAGFFASKSHNVIPADGCAIQNKSFAPIVDLICDFGTKTGWRAYNETSGQGLLRHIYLRIGEKTGEIMVCLVINGDRLPMGEEFTRQLTDEFPAVVSVMVNINKKNTNVVLGDRYITLWGKPYIEDELCGLRFKISPDSFYQVNRDGAELLYGLAREEAALCGTETLMDLYCGTGTIGLSMAERASRLCGVEIVSSAVECARKNAAENRITNAEFFCDDAGDRDVILRAAGGRRPDVVVIDPPRKGSTRELADTLSSLGVPKIVYVSCDPVTLARDCVWFRELGYEIGNVRPVDMFPRTGHVESVVCLTRRLDN